MKMTKPDQPKVSGGASFASLRPAAFQDFPSDSISVYSRDCRAVSALTKDFFDSLKHCGISTRI